MAVMLVGVKAISSGRLNRGVTFSVSLLSQFSMVGCIEEQAFELVGAICSIALMNNPPEKPSLTIAAALCL